MYVRASMRVYLDFKCLLASLLVSIYEYVLQAVALGAAVQAGIFEGTVNDLAVMDVWQAALCRAIAADHLSNIDTEDFDSESDDEDGTRLAG